MFFSASEHDCPVDTFYDASIVQEIVAAYRKIELIVFFIFFHSRLPQSNLHW